MLLLREEVEDAGDRARGAGGVDRAEDEMPRLGGVDRRLERLDVAQLAHEDDVGILTDGMFHADLEVPHVDADLPLIDEALVLGEDELDRILERENVLAVVPVDVVEHRADRGALAGARHAGEQHHPLVELTEPLDRGRQEELLEVGDAVVDLAGDEPPRPLLREQVHAEAPLLAVTDRDVGEVGTAVGVEDLSLPLAHEGRTQLPHLLVVDPLRLERLERALHAHEGGLPDLEVKVAAVELDERLEKAVDLQRPAAGGHGLHAVRLGLGGGGIDGGHASLGRRAEGSFLREGLGETRVRIARAAPGCHGSGTRP